MGTEPVLVLEDLFEVIGLLPLAPPMPGGELGPAIDARRALPRPCAFGGGEARAVLHLGASPLMYGAARWLDCCWPHYFAMRRLAAEWPGDGVVLARWAAWQATRAGWVV